VQAQALASLRALGKIALPNRGHVEIVGLRLDSAKGALLVRAVIRGEVRDRFLFVPVTRRIDGEVLLWGTPAVGPDGVRLDNLQLDVRAADDVVGLVAAMQRAQLTARIGEVLRIPKATLDAQARAVLAGLGRGVQVGGVALPVRVDTEQLSVEGVRAVGQRLEILVRFVGQVVVGDTRAR